MGSNAASAESSWINNCWYSLTTAGWQKSHLFWEEKEEQNMNVSSKRKHDSDATCAKINIFLFNPTLVLKHFKAVFLESEEVHHILFWLVIMTN